MIVRLSKIMMTGGLALWAFLAALGNIVDYDSNWAFVHHVMAMDTIFPDSTLHARAITDPTLQTIAYIAIITAELLTALAFAIATYLMAMKLRATKAEFHKAKSFTAMGVMLGIALWFIGFLVIGGEWFVMWQSSTWNGQSAAFMFVMIILAAGIYVFLDTDGDIEQTTDAL